MSWPEHGYDTAPPVHQYNTPPALIAFTLAILVVCFVAFSIVYLCKFCLVSVSQSWAFERSASGSLVRLSPNRSPSRSGGIDPSLLHMFPTFEYSFVKELRITMKNNDNKKKKKKHFLECAICLLEFEDDSMLRLLPICCHVFHQECIDLWLCSHKTCPVCRTDLNFPSSDTRRRIKHDSEFNNNNNHNHDDDDDDDEDEDDATEGDHPCEEEGSAGGDIRIDIRDGELGDDCESARARGEHDHHQDQDQDQMGVNVQQQQQAEHTRSHSTGHSIVMIKGEEVGVEKEGGGGDDDDDDDDDDEYTLRLPEHVIIRATRSSSSGGRHNCSKSCISYQEMQIMATTNCGFMESLSAAASSPSLPCAQKA